MDGWYYKLLSIVCGPVSQVKLIELIKEHTLGRNDEVRFGEKGNWRRIGSIGPLMTHLPFETAGTTVAASTPVASSTSNARAAVNHLDSDQDFDLDFAKNVSVLEAPLVERRETYRAVPNSVETMESGKPPEMDKCWWCMIQGKEYGPVELPKMIEWAATGRLRRDDHVRVGLDPYLRAGDLPGLFPALPSPTVTETPLSVPPASTSSSVPPKGAKSPESVTTTTPTANAAISAKSPDTVSPLSTTAVSARSATTNGSVAPPKAAPEKSVATPAPSPSSASLSRPTSAPPASTQISPAQTASAASPPVKAAAPTRPPMKPVKAKGGGGKLGALLPIGLGVVGVIALIALIYVGIQMIPPSTVEEVRRFKVLQEGYSSFQKLRDAGGKPSEDELKAAKDKVLQATKTVSDELKKIENKNAYQDSLKSLSAKMRNVANAAFDEKQKSKQETDVGNLAAKIEKDLGLK
jgi:hypothetical protein